MKTAVKPIVAKENTFDLLDIRVGRIIEVADLTEAQKPSYVIRADFGKYGIRTSVGRFTMHRPDELVGRQILGVLNFEPRSIGGISSGFLCLGVQYPKAESGEATPITVSVDVKLGSKLF